MVQPRLIGRETILGLHSVFGEDIEQPHAVIGQEGLTKAEDEEAQQSNYSFHDDSGGGEFRRCSRLPVLQAGTDRASKPLNINLKNCNVTGTQHPPRDVGNQSVSSLLPPS